MGCARSARGIATTYIDQAGNMALDGRAAEHEIDLIIRVA